MFFMFISILFLCNYGSTEDIKDLSTLEILKLGQDISQIRPYEIQPSDVQFYLMTKSVSEPVLMTSENREMLNSTRETKVVIHGWLENHKRSWYQSVADQYFENDDINFIEVDWERPARTPYIYSAKSTKVIGNLVAQFFEDADLSPKAVHIIGHSLGAHAAGFAGKKIFEDTGEKLQRITGLDPAGPYFRHSSINANDRLDKEDADIVDIIHTDAGFYGYESPLGTLDIYVNGGTRTQPGCLDEWNTPTSLGDIFEKSFCSHAKSIKYFIEWINTGTFRCRFCQSVLGLNLYADRCIFHHNDRLIGAEDVTVEVTGVCFTKTNKEEPYLN